MIFWLLEQQRKCTWICWMRSSIVGKGRVMFERKQVPFYFTISGILGHRIDAQSLHPLLKICLKREMYLSLNLTWVYWVIARSFCQICLQFSTLVWTSPSIHHWKWKRLQEVAFLASKRLLTFSEVLVHFDRLHEIVLSWMPLSSAQTTIGTSYTPEITKSAMLTSSHRICSTLQRQDILGSNWCTIQVFGNSPNAHHYSTSYLSASKNNLCPVWFIGKSCVGQWTNLYQLGI